MRARSSLLAVVTAAALVLLGGAAGVADEPQEPPVLGTLTLTPNTVGPEGGQVDVSIPVTDPDGTVASVTASAYSSLGGTVAATLGQESGGDTWTGALLIPALGGSGDLPDSWSVEITAVDDAGGVSTELLGWIDQGAFPQFDELPNADADVTPRDLPSSGGTVVITSHASDDHGVAEVSATVTDDEGAAWVVALDGVSPGAYRGSWEAPANSALTAHVYTVAVTATDDAGQQRFVNGGQVTVAGAPPPVVDQPPDIDAAAVTPDTLAAEGGVVEVSLHATDDVGIAAASATVDGPGGITRTIPLASAGGGFYRAEVQLFSNTTDADQDWRFDVTVTDTRGAVDQGRAGDVTVLALPVVDPPPVEVARLELSERVLRLTDTGRRARVEHAVTLTNTGTGTVTGRLEGLSRPFRSDVSTFALGPGESVTVTIGFRTGAPGRYADQLDVVRDDGEQASLGVRVIGRLRSAPGRPSWAR